MGEFINFLHTLSGGCNYGALRDEMIRDRIVVGILDSSLSERLQIHSDLTIENAIKIVRSTESIRHQKKSLRKPEEV